jgi:uncharacterized integral membrane protein (TIGR00697 family)
MFEDKKNILYFVLAGFFIANTLIAEFVGIKIFSLEQTLGFDSLDWTLFGVDGLGFNLTAGVILWPIVFVMTDIINEYFGTRGVKRLSYFAVILVLYAFIMIYLSMAVSPNAWWDLESGLLQTNKVDSMDAAYNAVFGQGLWIIIGSMVAFLVGQIVDVVVFHRIKKWTGEKKIWLRATGSTLVSQFIDSYVVLIIAFYIGSDWDLVRVIAIGTVNYFYKFGMAIILTPVIYLVHYIIDNYLGEPLATKLKEEAITP